jgi:diguanylate cyclase (GGDEF)-like protein
MHPNEMPTEELERALSERTAELLWVNERLVEALHERSAAEAAVQQLQKSDPVTGLPNRAAFAQRLAVVLQAHQRTGEPAAVLLVGIERLNDIRQAQGSQAADDAARAVADRLRMSLRGHDFVARAGADQFVVALEHLRMADDAAAVACKIADAVGAPLPNDGRVVRLVPTIGVSLFPLHGDNADALLARAEAAYRHVRRHDGTLYRYFEPEFEQSAARLLDLEAQLRRALEAEEFVLHYQPRVDLKKGRIVAVEALLRWNHPQEGLLTPDRFLDVVEASGLIVPLGAWVLARACADAARLPGSKVRVAVNLSPREFRTDALVALIDNALQEARLAPERLEVDLTEATLTAPGEAPVHAAVVCSELRARGVRVVLDRFGSGASSLTLLRNCPVDALKIDPPLIHNLERDRGAAAIVGAVADLGRHFEAQVIAMGVETEAQAALLRKLGCNEGQGYLYGRPMPIDELSALLGEKKASRRTKSAGTSARRGGKAATTPES